MPRNIPHVETDPDLPLFARRLKAARLTTGLSQEKLGVAAGVDEFSASARINQYERGKHTPDTLTASNLARVLKILCLIFMRKMRERPSCFCFIIVFLFASGNKCCV